MRGNMSWGLRKILQVRKLVILFFWTDIGDGATTLAWHDNWCKLGHLSNIITNRDIYRAGLGNDAYVSDLINAVGWTWP